MKPLSHSLTLVSLVAAMGAVACGSTQDGSGGSGATPATTVPDATGPCGIGKPTQFAGDANCILPPAQDEGLQLHIGPADYDNPDDTWVVPVGGEPTQNYHMYTPNTDTVDFFTQKYRMRTGSHHMIIAVSTDTTSPVGWNNNQQNIVSTIGGTQHLSEDFPPNGVVAPEDQGLARELAPNTPLDIQLHFYNTTSKPILREAWVNLYYKPKSEVTQTLGYMGGFAKINVPPRSVVTASGSCNMANAILPTGVTTQRIVTLFGHTHSHTTRFLVNRVKADGTTEIVYDNYDWSEGPTYTFNSLITNPTPDPSTQTGGAYSGDLVLGPGESLAYSCDINNDTDNALTFEEKVDTGEMCNLFGNVAGVGFPCFKLN